MHLKKCLFVLLITCFHFFAFSQDNILSDRPAAAYTSHVVGSKTLQIQHGIDFSRSEINVNPIGTDDYSIISRSYAFTNFIRYGIGSKNEINGIIDFRQSTLNGVIGDSRSTGISKIGLAYRHNLVEEKEVLPNISFLMVAHFNGILNEYRNLNTDGFALILLDKGLTDKLSFTGNFGINYNDVFSDNELYNGFLYTINFGYSLNDNLSCFVEAYGTAFEGDLEDYYDAGFAYLINERVQIDVFGGFTSRTNYLDYFVSGGISYNLGSQ